MTPPPLCATPGCARPAHPHTLCTHCTWTLERHLLDIPDLAAELDNARTRQTALHTGTTGRAHDAPLPYDPHAAAVAADLHRVLTATVTRLIAAPACVIADTTCLARWLHHNRHQLTAHPDAAQALTDLTAAITTGWRTVDRPTERRYAGTCPTHGCGAHLYAPAGHTTVTCQTCAAQHNVEALRTGMQAELDRTLMTGAEIARLAQYFGHADRERARALIKVWHARGVITPRGRTKTGAPLYRFGDTLTRLRDARRYDRTA